MTESPIITIMFDVPHVTDSDLRPIAKKVAAGEWLTEADGVALYVSRDLHGIGRMANSVAESRTLRVIACSTTSSKPTVAG